MCWYIFLSDLDAVVFEEVFGGVHFPADPVGRSAVPPVLDSIPFGDAYPAFGDLFLHLSIHRDGQKYVEVWDTPFLEFENPEVAETRETSAH